MSDPFIILERVGSGYFLKGGGRPDAFVQVKTFVIDPFITSISFNTMFAHADFCAAVVGWNWGDGSGLTASTYKLEAVKELDGFWHIAAELSAATGFGAVIHVMCISHAMCFNA